MVYIDVSSILAKNCKTGANDYSGTVAATVINNAIGALPATGGRVILKDGTYTITTTITLDDHVALQGEVTGSSEVGGVKLILGAAVDLITLTGGVGSHKVFPRIENLYLEGNGRAYAGKHAINMAKVSFPLIHDLRIQNFDGAGIYWDSVFNGTIENVAIDNCGQNVGGTNYSIFLGGSEGNADVRLHNVAQSSFKNIGLYITGSSADIHVSNYADDGAVLVADADYTHIYLDAGTRRIYFSNLDLRTLDTGINGINDLSDYAEYANVVFENAQGTLFNRGGAGISLLTNVLFKGVSAGSPAGNGFYCPLGTTIVHGFSYTDVTTPFFTNTGAGYLRIQGITPVQATDTVTAGASVWTYTNTRGFDETLVLTTVNGISAISYRGTAGFPITVKAYPFYLAPSDTIAVTWVTTAPVFTRYPH